MRVVSPASVEDVVSPVHAVLVAVGHDGFRIGIDVRALYNEPKLLVRFESRARGPDFYLQRDDGVPSN